MGSAMRRQQPDPVAPAGHEGRHRQHAEGQPDHDRDPHLDQADDRRTPPGNAVPRGQVGLGQDDPERAGEVLGQLAHEEDAPPPPAAGSVEPRSAMQDPPGHHGRHQPGQHEADGGATSAQAGSCGCPDRRSARSGPRRRRRRPGPARPRRPEPRAAPAQARPTTVGACAGWPSGRTTSRRTPRVAVLLEGLADHGEDRGRGRPPARALDRRPGPPGAAALAAAAASAARLLRCWARLVRDAGPRLIGDPAYDAVLVGYLGHFDVLLARLLLSVGRGSPAPAGLARCSSWTTWSRRAGTAGDRGLAPPGGLKDRVLRALDAAALRAADVVLVDTEQRLTELTDRGRRARSSCRSARPASGSSPAPRTPPGRGAAAGDLRRPVHAVAGRR